MTTPNYDEILNALDRHVIELEHLKVPLPWRREDARLLREAMEIVREHRDEPDKYCLPPA